MKKAMLIWNPAAGRIGVEGVVNQAVRALEQAGWNLRVEESMNAKHVTVLSQEARRDGFEAVFVAGGDGSLGRAVAGLMGSESALGVLPAGTANVWAQEIGLPVVGSDFFVESARRLTDGRVLTMDVGICQGRPFFLWAGFGLDGRVVDRLERNRSRLVKQFIELYYAWAVLLCAARWQGMRVWVKADDREVEGRFMVGVATNIRLYAGGLVQLSPEESWDDGTMSLWLLGSGENGGVRMVFRHAWNLYRGTHVMDENVIYLPFKRLKMKFEAEEWMQLDGEPWGRVKSVEINVKAQALRVLVPRDDERKL